MPSEARLGMALLGISIAACASSSSQGIGWGLDGLDAGAGSATGAGATSSGYEGGESFGTSSSGASSTSGAIVGTSSGGSAGSSSGATGGTSSTSSGGGSSGGGTSSGSTTSSSGVIDSGHSTSGGAGPCKRGIASGAAPSNAFLRSSTNPGIVWWYNWANEPASGGAAGIEFVPMIWGASGLKGPIPSGSRFVLGFNEPNFRNESNLSPQQAAADWPAVESLAKAKGIPLVSPAVNFCGNCTVASITDPYTYLKDFFAACSGCEVDYIAVHWYNCDLPSLQAYIEGNGGGLEGFLQFGKPIWLTEFACDATHSVADQKAYMEAAIPYLENNPNIYRYSWFSASPIPNAMLMNSDGSLTQLGATYVGLPANCN